MFCHNSNPQASQQWLVKASHLCHVSEPTVYTQCSCHLRTLCLACVLVVLYPSLDTEVKLELAKCNNIILLSFHLYIRT